MIKPINKILNNQPFISLIFDTLIGMSTSAKTINTLSQIPKRSKVVIHGMIDKKNKDMDVNMLVGALCQLSSIPIKKKGNKKPKLITI